MFDLLDTIIKGGSMMAPLMVCSVYTVAVLADRFWAFWVNRKVDTRALRARVLRLVEEGKIEDAAALCAATPGPISAVLLVGLQSYDKHSKLTKRPESLTSVMEKAMEDYAAHAVSAVEKRLSILSMIGNVAPLLGMTGTVTGMIASFAGLQSAGGIDNSAVAGGISEALITTAAGLIIAIAAVVPYNYFTAQADAIDLEIQEATSELLDFVATRVESSAA